MPARAARPRCPPGGGSSARRRCPVVLRISRPASFRSPASIPTAAALLNRYVPLPNSRRRAALHTVPVQSRQRRCSGPSASTISISDRAPVQCYVLFRRRCTQTALFAFSGRGRERARIRIRITAPASQQYSLSETWSISPTTVNEAHFTYFREGQLKFNAPADDQPGAGSRAAAWCPPSTASAIPTTLVLGIHPGPGRRPRRRPVHQRRRRLSYRQQLRRSSCRRSATASSWTDNLSKVIGNHSLKFGVDVRRMRFDQTLYYNVNGSYTFDRGGNNDVGASDLLRQLPAWPAEHLLARLGPE